MIKIPPERLSPEALRGLLEDFVTRETRNHDQDQYSVDQMIAQVRQQLDKGRLVIVYDEQLQTANVLRLEDVDKAQRPARGGAN